MTQTGKCVEGFAIAQCPQIERETSSTEMLLTHDSSVTERPPDDIILPKAERLSAAEASVILRAAQAQVIAIVGPTSSGKTSLIASLCDLFQLGMVGELQFARSRTFFAFEQACHHSRAQSMRSRPETEHTGLGSGVGFYHLQLLQVRQSKLVHVLLADRPGEDYRSAADDSSISGDFVEVHRANLITILLNGERLLDLTARHNVGHDAGMILQGLVNGDATRSTQKVAVVLTKFDTINRAGPTDKERAERDFDRISAEITRNFTDCFAEIRPFKIAASPSISDLAHGYGVAELLDYWMTPTVVTPRKQFSLPRSSRAMGRFTDFNSQGL